MPEVSVVVELRVKVDEEPDPVAFERQVAAEGRRAARELYLQALRVLDEKTTGASKGARQRLEERWVATTFGRVRIWRYRVKGQDGSFHPLDRVLGLSQAEASAALREAVCDLATRIPYRQVAQITSRLTGEVISHQSTWRILQAEGARVRAEEGELLSSVFELGEAPPEPGPAPELVLVEADGTYLAAQREQGDRFEIKTGVFSTGKHRAGGRRHRRFRLLDKGCYATTADSDRFGQGLAARGFAWVGLHRARHVGVRARRAGRVRPDVHRLVPPRRAPDRSLPRGRADLGGLRLRPCPLRGRKALAFSDPAACARTLRRSRLVRPEVAHEVAGYLQAVAEDLHGVDRLPRGVRTGRMHVVGSGVVEKHQDLVVKRRMKGKGMRWTRRGADHLLALQARRLCDQWPTRWGVVAA